MRPARRSTPGCRPATCASAWAASRPSWPSTTCRAWSGTWRRSGPTKRGYAEKLIRRLRERFAPGGLLHYGQGKWYPGESLPRWAFAVYWRSDGEPLWRNADLIDAETPKSPATVADAERFAAALGKQLGLPPGAAMAAYEDPVHFMLAEQKLPVAIDPEDNKLADPGERRRLMRVFEHGLDTPAEIRACRSWRASPARKGGAGARNAGCSSAIACSCCRATHPSDCACRWPRWSSCCRWSFPRCCPTTPMGEAAALPQRHVLDDEPAPRRGSRRGGSAHGDGHRGARRPSVRVPAAGRQRRGFLRPGGRHRAGRGCQQPSGAPGRLHAARRPAPQQHQGDARSRRDRDQCAPRDVLGAGGRHHQRRLRGSREGAAWQPRSSCSTAVTSAPAAATTSCWAASRPRTARSCAGPTCWPASSPIGRTIPRCPTCSPACSSARPARRRASTRRGTTRSTSSRSR